MRHAVWIVTLLMFVPCAWCEEEGAKPPKEVAKPETPPAQAIASKSYVEARKDFDDVVKSKDYAALVSAMEVLVKSAVDGEDKKQRKATRKVLKKLLRHKQETIVVAALHGYGTLCQPKSSRDLKGFVDKKACKRKSIVLRMEAIRAWAQIHDPGTQEALLNHIKLPSPDKELCELAVLCATEMRHFKCQNRKELHALLDDYMKAYDMVHSSGIGAFMSSAVAAEWWDELKDPLLESFNILTEMKFERYRDCSDWWRKTRKEWR